MNTSATRLLTRLTLWMGALFAAGALYAGPAEDFDQANAAFAIGDLPTGMALMRKASDQNHAKAQARMGDLLRDSGYEAEAIPLYRKSAEQGEAAGEYGLGRAYADGAGVPKDPAQALEWYRKAEKRNYAPAFDVLARAYRSGSLGLTRDLEQARSYEERARAATAQTAIPGASR